MPPVLKRSKKVCILLFFSFNDTASPWPSCYSRPEDLNLGFGHYLLSLMIDPCKDVWVRLADDFLHPGMPSLNMVVGSGLMLIEIVPVNQRSFQIACMKCSKSMA